MAEAEQTLGSLIDQLFKRRSDRKKMEEKVAALRTVENEAEAAVIAALQKSKLESAKGKRGQATITFRPLATVIDWAQVYAYVRKNNAFELLHKRIAVTACAERWETGVEIPGVMKETKLDLSLTASKK